MRERNEVKRIAIASGKGGTGKTTVATSLALALNHVQYVDCDVEEPNGHIFLNPSFEEAISVGIPVPSIDKSRCTYCGQCAASCVFHAIAVSKAAEITLVFDQLCHGCGVCSYVCPEQCITEQPREIGVVQKGQANGVTFVQGVLNVGEAMAPPLIRAVKKHLAEDRIVLIDASPGTSCPVVEAVQGNDFCILVTEPTPFGLNDLVLAVEMCRAIGIPMGVIVNRHGLGNDQVEGYCQQEGVPILMRIPFERRIAEAYSIGKPLIEALPEYRAHFQQLYEDILSNPR